ncbi:MAG: ATP synthase F0 subunit C [Phycisphaerae bacterium]
MKKGLFIALLALLALPAIASAAPVGGVGVTEILSGKGAAFLGLGIGLGLLVFGAAKGIGSIGSHAVDAIARQPEAGGRIFTTMIISAALIEGATLFAIVVILIKGGVGY